jgi:uncharacterized protein (TIGR03545 family)
MTRFFRLGYILPRLVLLVVLYCALEYGTGWGLHYAVVSGGQSAIGAKVELDSSAVSVLEARATLTGLRVTNPKRPMENLLEAEKIELDFESDSFLRKKVIANHGVVRGIKFNTPRETSGALDPEDETLGSDAPGWFGGAGQAAGQAADKWLDDIELKFAGDHEDFESVKLARELSQSWPQRFDKLNADAKSLQAEVETLREQAKEARSNPLRGADFLAAAPQRAADLRQRLANLHAELTSLPAEVKADKSRIDDARRRDEALIRERLQVNQLDPQSLTSQLLGEQVTGSIDSLVGWVRWTRQMVPSSKVRPVVTQRTRGVDVNFAGVRQRPDLLIRELAVSGSARMGGRPMELVGTITDFTTSPAIHGKPIRAVFNSTGGLEMVVRLTVDRTGGVATDELIVDCPAFDLPQGQLGNPEKLGLAMAPSTGSLSVSLRIEGEQLSGDIQLVQDRVALSPVVGPSASKLARRMGDAVGSSLATLPKPATRVTLSGTLDDPKLAVWSTLGPAVAESLQNAATNLAREEAQKRLESTQQKLAGELASLDRKVNDAMTKLTAEVEAPRQEIERLASNWIGEQLGGGTFSFEQLGKRLPAAESLFKK